MTESSTLPRLTIKLEQHSNIGQALHALDTCFVPINGSSPESDYELGVEQTPDGAFRRNNVTITSHFGDETGQAPVVPGRYHVVGVPRCGWNRRQRITLRLLGLDSIITPEIAYGRDGNGWKITKTSGGVAEKFGTTRVNDFYRRTSEAFQPDPSKPNFTSRGTTPIVVDLKTGRIVSNNYHTLTNEWETAWKDYHRQGAPDLYPVELKQEIDLLNQQIFDDINNGTYKVIFARNAQAAKAAYEVYKARLIDFDFRLESRRYLFGDHLTDSDIRLFQTLESYEFTYRPGLVKRLETEDILHIDSLSNIWAYARDLFQTPGFVDEVELYELGYVPFKEEDISWYGEDPDNEDGSLFRVGEYSIGWAEDSSTPFGTPVDDSARRKEHYESWLEPSGRGGLAGLSAYSGPGGGGSYQLWSIGKNATVYNG